MIVKSSARGEIARWVQAIRLNMEYYQKGGKPIDRTPSTTRSQKAPSIHSAAAAAVNDLPPAEGLLHPGLKRTATGISGLSGRTGATSAPSARSGGRHLSSSSSRRRDASPGHTTASDAASSTGDQASLDERQNETVPHESEFELGMLNLKAQLELTEQLIGSLVTPPPSTHGSPDPSRASSIPSRQQEVKDALRESLTTITGLVQRQHEMTLDREKFFASRIKREVQARKLWEDNLLAVAEQQAETDRQLTEAAKDNEKKRRALRQARGVLAEISLSTPTSPQPEPASALTAAPMVSSPERVHSVEFAQAVPAPLLQQSLRQSVAGRGHAARRSISLSKSMSRGSISVQDVNEVVAAMDDDEDDDDEFFDAIETGTIPNLKLYDSIANPERPASPAPAPVAAEPESGEAGEAKPSAKGTMVKYLSRKSIEPYAHVRHKLPIDDDKRPSVSCELNHVRAA